MKKHIFLLISILLFTKISFAEGNIPPIVKKSAFYAGMGFSYMKLNNDLTDEEFNTNAVTLQAGYKYNNYLSVEGRYSHHVGDVEYKHGSTSNPYIDDYPTDFNNIAIYLKPIYPIGNLSLYALIGYGEVELTDIPLGGKYISADRAEDGFQWGAGIDYTFNENISLFVDYVQLYNDTGFDYRAIDADILVDIYTLGISYKF